MPRSRALPPLAASAPRATAFEQIGHCHSPPSPYFYADTVSPFQPFPPQANPFSMPLSHSQTNQLLSSLGHEPRKQLGQNFLVDGNIVQKSVRLASLSPEERVVEVGPGLGTLTGCMLEHGAFVYAVEFDKRLYQHLQESLQPRFAGHLDLLNADAVDFPLANLPVEKLRSEALAKTAATASTTAPTTATAATATPAAEPVTVTADFKIIANLPYAISTPWLESVLSGPIRPQRMVLMLQKEAAERFVASPGNKTYGAISIFTASAYRVAATHAVSRQCFFPIPGVDSVLLSLEALPQPQPWPEQARQVVRQFFTHRRKQIGSLVRRVADELHEQAQPKKLSAKQRAAASAAEAEAEQTAATGTVTATGSNTAPATGSASPATTPAATPVAELLIQWLDVLEREGISQETRPEAVPLRAWQELAKLFAKAGN